MKCGIIGLPNVGKSTLFNCLSNTKAQAANYPFCTIEPNFSVIPVPDPRIFELTNIVKPNRLIPAVIEIIDIAGLVKGASQGEGLGNKFLSHIRNTHAMIHVVRCFDNKNITHINDIVDPIKDTDIINLELQLKDLEIIEKKINKIKNQIKNNNNDKELYNLLDIIKKNLLQGKNIRELSYNELEKSYINNLQLITAKPMLYVCNVDENSIINGNLYTKKLIKSLLNNKDNTQILIISAQIESEITELHTLEERNLFLSQIGLLEPGINRIIQAAYKLMNLHTFFTVSKKEIKAWTIKKGTSANKAARIIHSDFEKGFICAKVIKYKDYIKYQSEKVIRELGKISIEGKKYIIEDGDIIHFEFNI